jgi:hypothetical protein
MSPYIAARDGAAARHVPPKALIPSPFNVDVEARARQAGGD